MKTSDFDFELPPELIAQCPPQQRGKSRLLHLDHHGAIQDYLFSDLIKFVRAGDVWVFNNTRVIKARLFGEKASGGKIEVLIERIIDDHHALAQIRASHAPQPGTQLNIAGTSVKVINRKDEFFRLEFKTEETILSLLDRVGKLPLPPYIDRSAEKDDDARYQTVYAKIHGAVAAPTAGLHFNESMLKQLESAGAKIVYLTLHVGAGTFQPVRSENISEHKMHSERYHISEETVAIIEDARNQGNTITAVGTTTLRALESAAQHGKLKPGFSETDIFITPGYQFKIVNRLLTNFHLPKSTLLMLVSAFSGLNNIKNAYRHAIEKKYRFFSYGDAMLIERTQS
jgi:S-adenosylmethionine:tRNA ribosyltransferase-isomerase